MKNPKIANVKVEILAENWNTLQRVTSDYQKSDGTWQTQVREVYKKDDGSVVLLYNKEKKTVILTRQFRLPTYLHSNKTGMLIEAPAGLLDGQDPETCIRREAEEEVGYKIKEVKRIFDAYMSPGSILEMVYFFVAPYDDDMKISEGGGHEHEQENIEVLEILFDEAWKMMENGEILDGKTIMLLQYAKVNKLL
jgi:nudix-type nucleoside diphosphatase (YffH/AdpP family)